VTLHLTSTSQTVTVMLLDDSQRRSRGIASADWMVYADEAVWYVNRVLVTHEKDRGQGIGGMLLDRLLAEVCAQQDGPVIVTPGGYGADPDRQERFYESHGFIRVEDERGKRWVWSRKKEDGS
jgi:GNAT superfamily N-acetyltransferase